MQQKRFIHNSNQLNVFRAINSPILRSKRLFTACGTVHPQCCQLVTSRQHRRTLYHKL